MCKKIFFILTVFIFVGFSSFACKYNSLTHKIKECSDYTDVPTPEKCRKAHDEYNAWLVSETKAKLKKKVDSTKKEIKSTSKKVEKKTKKIAEKATDTGNKLKDSFFQFVDENFNNDTDSSSDDDIKSESSE